MQLQLARLCLNCDEVHDQQTCPICSSESYVHISRWIPVSERRQPARQVPSPETADTYRQLLDPNPQPSGARRWMKRGAFGLGAAALAAWAWRHTGAANDGPTASATAAPPERAEDT